MRIVNFEGKQYRFPADATDEEIAAALGEMPSVVPNRIGSGRGFYQNSALLQKELESEYGLLKSTTDENSRQLHARNIIALRRALGNKNTESLPIDEENPDYVALLRMVEREALPKTLPDSPAEPAPRAAQADVRRTEPEPLPMEKQEADEAAFQRNFQAWMKATGGVLKPGQTQRQAVTEWSGQRDPRETREQAEGEHLRSTGELQYGDSVAYNAAKTGAAMGGFAYGGPAGATFAEAAVRAISLTTNLRAAVDAGHINNDQAADIFIREFVKGFGEDALFNFGLPLVAQVIAKVPGAKPLGEKIKAFIEKGVAKATEGLPGSTAVPRPSQRDLKIAERANLLPEDDIAGREAVEALGKHSKDVVPTPGQVLDDAGMWESNVRKASPKTFARQEKDVETAAKRLLRETTTPAGQMRREDIGNVISQVAEDTQRAVKNRLRPVFEAADNIGVQVDMRSVRHEVSRQLLKDVRAAGKLNPSERAELERVFEHLRTNPYMTAESALDFIKRRKELSRAMSADGEPTEAFKIVLDELARQADKAYVRAAQAAGESQVVRDLLRARQQYGAMMETIYDDAVKQALKKNPEDVGRLFWQTGNVSEIKQLHRMLRLAEKESVVGAAGAEKIKHDVARGFLQEAVPNIEAAATWSARLNAPGLRDTWETITNIPGGRELRHTMEVVERAARMALRDNATLATQGLVPLQRAGTGSMGVSNVSMKPGWIITGISLTGITRAAATAYTQGEKGVLNMIARALTARDAGTAAGAKTLQEILPKLYEWAEKNGHEDIFQQEPQSRESLGQMPVAA